MKILKQNADISITKRRFIRPLVSRATCFNGHVAFF
jgi:hypothetical protein